MTKRKTGFKNATQRNKAQSNYEQKNARIQFVCNPELKARFDLLRGNLSCPDFQKILLDNYEKNTKS